LSLIEADYKELKISDLIYSRENGLVFKIIFGNTKLKYAKAVGYKTDKICFKTMFLGLLIHNLF
jgi:hypothetical protein